MSRHSEDTLVVDIGICEFPIPEYSLPWYRYSVAGLSGEATIDDVTFLWHATWNSSDTAYISVGVLVMGSGELVGGSAPNVSIMPIAMVESACDKLGDKQFTTDLRRCIDEAISLGTLPRKAYGVQGYLNS